jgi:hypothetical protein
MALIRRASGSFPLAGRFPQCRQHVSVVMLADQGEHGGEGDGGEAGAGDGRGPGGHGGDHVVHEEQRSGFLPGEGRRPAAQHAAGAADGLLQVKESGLTCHLAA